MTTRGRILEAPRLDAETFAVRATARASHGLTLAELANDAATGHPGQRLTIGRTTGGTFYGWIQPSKDLRLLRVTTSVAWRAAGTYTAGHGVSVAIEITDGTTTVTSPPAIPTDFGTSLFPQPGVWRLSTLVTHTGWLDYGALVTAGLDASQVWRLKFLVTCDATVVCESVLVEEVPRLVTDDADDAGLIPDAYQPRQVILAGATSFLRVEETMRAAYYQSLRTYHHGAPGEADPYVCTSGSYAPMGQDSDDGDARRTIVRARKIRGAAQNARVRLRCRYRMTGASSGNLGFLRLHTGVGTYVITLTDVSGSWADSAIETGYLATAGSSDTLYFDAKRDAGTLEVSARTVWDYPAA